ncbi:hypothetical protein [Roseibium sp.]|uniref:hypothetical protein n=1 Tax=Roseibium sp. TaxID=1936156 RepID=UPI0035180B85
MRRIAAVCLFVFLAGCATYKSVPFEQSSAQPVKTIALVKPAVTNQGPIAMLATSYGQSFGLIGLLVDAGMTGSREGTLQSILSADGFRIQDAVETELTTALEEQGYTVVMVNADRGSRREFLTTYPDTPEPVDAYLDVIVPGYGYAAAGVGDSKPWKPVAIMKTRLVRATDNKVLMRDDIVYNRLSESRGDTVTITGDPQYSYPDFSGLENNRKQAAEGVRVAVRETAKTVGKLLK